jgi:Icc-related predicted phosphoesterase
MQLDRSLKILAGSDLHNSKQGLEWFIHQAEALQPDLVVFLGDFITGEPLAFIRETLIELRGLAPHCFVVPGNWDPRNALVEIDRQAYDGLRNLHKAQAQAGGYLFVGIGGSITTPIGTTPLESTDEGFAEPTRSLLPVDIWLLHNPLKGLRDQVGSGMHVGSESLLELWSEQEQKPLLVLSGHIHEAAGHEIHGGTVFCNPGSLAEKSASWIMLKGDTIDVEMLGG